MPKPNPMPKPQLLWLGQDDGARQQLLELVRATEAYEVLQLASIAALASHFQSSQPVVILVDADLVGGNPSVFLKEIAAVADPTQVPVLLVVDPGRRPEQATFPSLREISGTLLLEGDLNALLDHLAALAEEKWLTAQLGNLYELGGAPFVVELIDLFLKVTPAQLDEAQQRLAAGDWISARRAVHSLRSSAGNLGAVWLWSQAGIVEDQLAAEQNAEHVALLLNQLRQTYQQIEGRLLKHRAAINIG